MDEHRARGGGAGVVISGGVAKVGDRRAREIHRVAVAIANELDVARIVVDVVGASLVEPRVFLERRAEGRHVGIALDQIA